MKSIPSTSILSDELKRSFIVKILAEANLTLSEYSDLVSNRTIVLRKQILTEQGLLMLTNSEYQILLNNLRNKYPSLFCKGKVKRIFA